MKYLLILSIFLTSCCSDKCFSDKVEIKHDTTYTEVIHEQEVMDESFFIYCDSIGNLYTMLLDSMGNYTPIRDTVRIQGKRMKGEVVVKYEDNSKAYLSSVYSLPRELEKQTIVYKQEISKIKAEKEKWQIISLIELLLILAALVVLIKITNK